MSTLELITVDGEWKEFAAEGGENFDLKHACMGRFSPPKAAIFFGIKSDCMEGGAPIWAKIVLKSRFPDKDCT